MNKNIIKILSLVLFFASLFVLKAILNAETLGDNKSDVFGDYPSNYVSVDCPTNKICL